MGAWTNAALGVASMIVFATWSGSDYILAAEPQISASTADDELLILILRSTKLDRREILKCRDGRMLFDRDGMWGIRDTEGHEVIAPRYRALDCFGDIVWAAIDEQRQWCAMVPDGTLRDPVSCRAYYSPVNWTHTDQEQLDRDLYESSVLWARARLEFGAGKRDRPPRLVSNGGGGIPF